MKRKHKSATTRQRKQQTRIRAAIESNPMLLRERNILIAKFENLVEEGNKRLAQGEDRNSVEQWIKQEEVRIYSEINLSHEKS